MKHVVTVRMVTHDDVSPDCPNPDADPDTYQATLSAFVLGIEQIPGIDRAELAKDGQKDQLHIESALDKNSLKGKLEHAFRFDFSRLRFVSHEVVDLKRLPTDR